MVKLFRIPIKENNWLPELFYSERIDHQLTYSIQNRIGNPEKHLAYYVVFKTYSSHSLRGPFRPRFDSLIPSASPTPLQPGSPSNPQIQKDMF